MSDQKDSAPPPATSSSLSKSREAESYQETFIESAPAYEEEVPEQPALSTIPSSSKGAANLAPTISAPFNFPTDAPPQYSNADASAASSSGSAPRPIAFPQVRPDADAPFVTAYAPILLSYGVTKETWRSFLDTISAFLSAKVSDRAISHAGDVASRLGEAPKSFGKNVATHAKSIGKNVTENAKRGNIIGAAMGVIGGTISLPVTTALGIVGTTLSLPGTAIGALAKKPKTPYERAATYAAVANQEWLHARGLHAQLVDTAELAKVMGLPVERLLEVAAGVKDADAAAQLRALEPHLAHLEVTEGSSLQLKARNFWLILLPKEMFS